MALYTRAIKTKIRSIGNIRKITRAMEMVAVSKMRKAVVRALSSRPYATHARELLIALESEGGARHPLLTPGAGWETLIIVFASDKGLCGGFNVVLGKALARFVAEVGGTEACSFVTIGRYAERIVRRLRGEIAASFIGFAAEDAIEMRSIAQLARQSFLSGRYRRVVIAYNDYISAVSFRPTMRTLLPIGPDNMRDAIAALGVDDSPLPVQGMRASSPYLFEPSQERLLDQLVPQIMEVLLFQAYVESAASEHSARMVAMKNASDNANDLLSSLTLSYNHARQDGITQEISEIAGGANALASAA
jgi:F-type H+-transporting ATPase subunit gamma